MYLFTFVITLKNGSQDVFECFASTTSQAWAEFNRLDTSNIESVSMSYRCAY